MSYDEIYKTNILISKIKIQPQFLNKNYRKHIIELLKTKYENIYSKFGIIKKDSIELLELSNGSLEQNSFQGNIIYNVSFSALVCNPAVGDIISCKVTNLNNFGILCIDQKYSIIEIIVPKKSLAIQSDIEVNNIKKNDSILVEILGKKPELFDKKIRCIGKIKKTSKSSTNQIIEQNDTIIIDGDLNDDDNFEDDSKIINDEDDDDDTVSVASGGSNNLSDIELEIEEISSIDSKSDIESDIDSD
tara:strand:+ start:40 stop:777 length:738 start_codon:yes stop_codon:yes gene_type:complete